MADIGPKIGVDGEREFRADINRINQALKTLGSEAKAVAAEFENDSDSAEALSRKNDVLERSVLTLRDKLKMQEEMLDKAGKKYGEADVKTLKWRQAVNETTAALNKAEAEIRRNNDALEQHGAELDNVAEETETATGKTGGLFDGLKNLKGAAILGGLAAVATAIKNIGEAAINAAGEAARYADDINTLAKVTGLSTETLQEFEYMSSLIDVDVDTLRGSLSRLTRNMNDARNGTGNAADVFERLGVRITDETGELRDNEDVFYELIDALGEMENETERDAASMEIFGKSAQELNPLIIAGADAAKEFAKEAKEMGAVHSQEELDKLNAYNDAVDRMKQAWKALKDETVLTYQDKLTEKVERLTEKFKDWRESIEEIGVAKTVLNDVKTGLGYVEEGIDSLFSNIFGNMQDLFGGGNTWNDGLGAGIGGYDISPYLPKSQPQGTIQKPSASVNVYTQSMTQSQTDYLVNQFNTHLGGTI